MRNGTDWASGPLTGGASEKPLPQAALVFLAGGKLVVDGTDTANM